MSILTFNPSTDAYLYKQDVVYATAHDAASGTSGEGANYLLVGQETTFSGAIKYLISRSGLHFDTSSIPDGATITAATLRLCVIQLRTDISNFNIHVVSGADLDDPLVGADYGDVLNDTVSRGVINTADADFGDNVIDIDLDPTGIGEISKTGTTKFALRTSDDIDSTSPPATNNKFNRVMFGSVESAGQEPQLIVTYTSTVGVTTDAASSIASATATLNGTLDDEGSGACTCGFDYGTTVAYGTQVQAAGTYNTGQSFLKAIASLLPGTTYHARAYADNGVDAVAYGADVTFTTLGVVYPSQTITRVTSLVHRYHRKQGIYSLELNLGGVTSDFGIPVWSSMFQSAASPTVPPTEEAIEEIVRRLNTGIIKTEGFQIPTLTPESVQPTKPIMYIQTPEDLQSYKVKTAPPPSGPLIELAPKKWWEFWK